MTFSIVAHDPVTGQLGGAVASRFLAVGGLAVRISAIRRKGCGAEVGATSLLQDAIVKLLQRQGLNAENRRHFFFVMKRAIRDVLAERLRAGGAGIPAFYTKTGFGTIVAQGKETRQFDGHNYVMERGLFADLSLVKAWKGDKAGNLIYRMTARNFNPMVATASKFTVAEVEELVEVGELDPDQIHTPGIFVKRILCGAPYDKKIEQRTIRKA